MSHPLDAHALRSACALHPTATMAEPIPQPSLIERVRVVETDFQNSEKKDFNKHWREIVELVPLINAFIDESISQGHVNVDRRA